MKTPQSELAQIAVFILTTALIISIVIGILLYAILKVGPPP